MKSSIHIVLSKAVIRVLKPLISVLMRNEMSHSQFVELAKQAYIEVAYDKFSIPNRKMTYSRVAVLTGLSRKEVVRVLKENEADNMSYQATPNRAMRVINGWLQDSDFLDDDSEPLLLPQKGEGASFASLVERYSGDITSGAVLDELVRIGVVMKVDHHHVKLHSHGYVPHEDELRKMDIMSICAADLLTTAVYNLEHDSDNARFQRQVVYHDIPVSVAREFKGFSHARSDEVLRELNNWLKDRKEFPESETEPTQRVGMGIYYFEGLHESDSKDKQNS